MNADLLERARAGDRGAKEHLLMENSGLIWSIVRRYLGRGVESDDLYQLGCLGFLKAIDGFDERFGTQFSTYAVPKISGEIRRFLRDDGTVKVSRTLKEQAGQIRNARSQLTGTLGREPLISEISEITGLTLEEIAIAETAALPADSLQRPASEDGCSLEQLIPGESIEDTIIEAVSLRNAIALLEQRQRAVIQLRYYRGMTQEKAAAVLGISQVQVSRIEKKSLQRLRELLEGE